jgi:hypothetical protein
VLLQQFLGHAFSKKVEVVKSAPESVQCKLGNVSVGKCQCSQCARRIDKIEYEAYNIQGNRRGHGDG